MSGFAMHSVSLYGALGDEFVSSVQFRARTVGDVIRLLAANFPNFEKRVRNLGEHAVVVNGVSLRDYELETSLPAASNVEIVPKMSGRGKGGKAVLFFLAAAVLFAASGGLGAAATTASGKAAALSQTAVAVNSSAATAASAYSTQAGIYTLAANAASALAFNLASAGLQTLLLPSQDDNDEDPSYYFSGQVNRPGFAIPVVYGDVLVPGRAVSVFAESTDKRTNIASPNPVDALRMTSKSQVNPDEAPTNYAWVRGVWAPDRDAEDTT